MEAIYWVVESHCHRIVRGNGVPAFCLRQCCFPGRVQRSILLIRRLNSMLCPAPPRTAYYPIKLEDLASPIDCLTMARGILLLSWDDILRCMMIVRSHFAFGEAYQGRRSGTVEVRCEGHGGRLFCVMKEWQSTCTVILFLLRFAKIVFPLFLPFYYIFSPVFCQIVFDYCLCNVMFFSLFANAVLFSFVHPKLFVLLYFAKALFFLFYFAEIIFFSSLFIHGNFSPVFRASELCKWIIQTCKDMPLRKILITITVESDLTWPCTHWPCTFQPQASLWPYERSAFTFLESLRLTTKQCVEYPFLPSALNTSWAYSPALCLITTTLAD